MGETFTLKIESGDVFGVSSDDHLPDYDPELDDLGGLLGDVCEILQNSNVKFVVSGFGQGWSVDVNTDLLVVMEQINSCLQQIDVAKFDFCLEFYEQGVERRLIFSESDNEQVKVLCESDTDWVPCPVEIFVDRETIALMLSRLKSDFVSLAKNICPKLSSHDWFDNWAKEPARHSIRE